MLRITFTIMSDSARLIEHGAEEGSPSARAPSPLPPRPLDRLKWTALIAMAVLGVISVAAWPTLRPLATGAGEGGSFGLESAALTDSVMLESSELPYKALHIFHG